MPKKDESLAAQVGQIIIKQALGYLPDAMRTLGELASEGKRENTRVQASRAIINAAQMASGGMTEDQAGEELLAVIRAKANLDVPDVIRDAFDEDDE